VEYVPGTSVSLQNGAPWQHLNYHPHLHQSSKKLKIIVRLNKLSRAAKKKNKNKTNKKQNKTKKNNKTMAS
jgi:hypothetical protein